MATQQLHDRAARAVLADLFAPSDPDIGTCIKSCGPSAALDKVLTGDLPPRLAEQATRSLRAKGLASADDLAAHAERLEYDAFACGARMIAPGDPSWPIGLDQLAVHTRADVHWRAPWCLWAKGRLTAVPERHRLVGFWGHRVGSPLGDWFARTAANRATRAGYTIAAVGETGIAWAALHGALTLGPVIAFVTGGLDQPEPEGNRGLFDTVADRGMVLSAQPPGHRSSGPAEGYRDAMLAAACGALAFVEAPYTTVERPVFTIAHNLQRTIVSFGSPLTFHRQIGNRRLESRGALAVRNVSELIGHVSAGRWNF